jgi:hypothetical protein
MTKNRTHTGLWSRTTKALGKIFAGVVSLADDRRQASTQATWTDYPRFPMF